MAPIGRGPDPTDDLGEIISGDGLLLEEGGDDCVEDVTVVAQQAAGPVLGLGEQAAHLLVDDLLGAFSVGTLLAEWGPAQVRRLV
jgi:hypothetical protein